MRCLRLSRSPSRSVRYIGRCCPLLVASIRFSVRVNACVAGRLSCAGLVDDAAVLPAGQRGAARRASPRTASTARAWYADLVGPLLVPAVRARRADRPARPGRAARRRRDRRRRPIDALPAAVDRAPAPGLRVRQVEAAVAKRGEDPQPGLRRLLARLGGWTWLTGVRRDPAHLGPAGRPRHGRRGARRRVRIAPKFRTGGLAAELFPTPVELAAVICACRDRELPFKLTAGLHHALRHTDPETGFTHHGFLNVLVAAARRGRRRRGGRRGRGARRDRPGAAGRAGPRRAATGPGRCGSASARAACWSR